MKLMTIPAAALAATFLFAQSAQAREHHRHHGQHHDVFSHDAFSHDAFSHDAFSHDAFSHNAFSHGSRVIYRSRRRHEFAQQEFGGGFWNGSEAATYHGGLGGRPSAWCGWEMRQLVSSDPGPQFNLARNWARWGHSGPPGIGAVVVWPHHVGKIVGQEGGQWVIKSGNDGHALRTRPRSIAGAIAIRWG